MYVLKPKHFNFIEVKGLSVGDAILHLYKLSSDEWLTANVDWRNIEDAIYIAAEVDGFIGCVNIEYGSRSKSNSDHYVASSLPKT